MTIEEKIKENLEQFTKTEEKIYKYFLDNKRSIAFLSIQELSENLELGRASILRFANKLGFKGFAALKKEIINELKDDISPLDKFSVSLNEKAEKNFNINHIAEDEVKNINHLVNNFDQKKFNKAANLIMEAENIYIAGHGSSHYIAGLSAFLLQRVGYRAFHLNNSSLSFVEQLVNIRKDDLLIEFSFPPYFSNTTMAAEFAKKQKAGVISITNSVVAPVTKHSSVSLIVKTENQILTNSMTPIIVLLYTLIDEVAVKDKERSKNTIRKLISTREEN